jgi:hypothetical protein
MTPEERERYVRIDRLLEFLANNQAELSAQQAQLSAELNKLKEITALHTTQIEAQGKQIAELGNFVLRLGHIVENQVSAQARTDERLNALIGVAERYFSNGRK